MKEKITITPQGATPDAKALEAAKKLVDGKAGRTVNLIVRRDFTAAMKREPAGSMERADFES